MFELGDAIEDATAIGTASSESLLAQVKPLIITQRRLHARTILAAFRVGELAYNQALELQLTERGMVNGLPDKIAVREVANQFAIPRPQATRWLTRSTSCSCYARSPSPSSTAPSPNPRRRSSPRAW